MNDPWDVKSVRQSGQYVSYMKINGVPLLPPVLSKECRKEMQYYKLLAKEVEKRISILQPYIVDSDTESEDKTDAPDLPESEQNYELPLEEMQAAVNINIDQISANNSPKSVDKHNTESPKCASKLHNSVASNNESLKDNSPKFVIDLSLKIKDSAKNCSNVAESKSPPVDMPERDYNCVKKINAKELITEVDSPYRQKRESDSYPADYKDPLPDPMSDYIMSQDGPSSLSSKSFTGSLNDIHSEAIKDGQIGSKLIRQRSYTLLKPSPQLLAHLEVQSLSTGIEMHSISMSESLSNLSTPKKRRIWDLETAKVKWSSMALELKQKNVNRVNKTVITKYNKKSPQITPPRAKSVIVDRTRRNSVTPITLPKSEPISKVKKSPAVDSTPSNRTIIKEPMSPTVSEPEPDLPTNLAAGIADSEDPATRIRELYEKIQKQQLIQMATLVEKQKREQLLLQQVFEEQNNMLFKQLKTICPKSLIEAKEAWGHKQNSEAERGPVSLSQLINPKSPDQSLDSPVSTTLTDTNNYINQCDSVLKKSRDITGSIKKQQAKSRSQNGNKIQTPRSEPEGSRTRTHSPTQKSTSRKLNYDTSASSDREYDPILTDRTNDTLADLNVTFPSDSDGNNYNVTNHLCGKEVKTGQNNSGYSSGMHSMFTRTDSAIRSMERTIQNSINSSNTRATKSLINNPPTPKQRAAATRIVAVAKGFLVRRLMRTERVQATVQTIKDALLCALQLHQDREGIRGADVDLHRRLIQQITAACYSLHDTFIASTPAERCAMIGADRGRRRSLANRNPPKSFRQTDIMSQSHTGAFPARSKRHSPASAMTQSNYETFSGDKSPLSRRHMPAPRRRPWR